MNLEKLPAFLDGSKINVVIETPRGSRSKFKYDSESRIFRLHKLLPVGLTFPFHFGFVPGTRGQDGDPLDVLVLLDVEVPVGTLVAGIVLGAIKATQTGHQDKTVRNDRLIAMADLEHQLTRCQSLEEVPHDQLLDMEQFFINMNRQEGKRFEVMGRASAEEALGLIRGAKR
jgi:inorganic pyrophosphatase